MGKNNRAAILTDKINEKLRERKECNWEALELYLINDSQKVRRIKLGVEVLKVVKYLPVWLSPLCLFIDYKVNIVCAIAIWLSGAILIGGWCTWIGEIIKDVAKSIDAYNYDPKVRIVRSGYTGDVRSLKGDAELWVVAIVYQAKKEYYYMANLEEFIKNNKEIIISKIEKYYKLSL